MYIGNNIRIFERGCICCKIIGFIWWSGRLIFYREISLFHKTEMMYGSECTGARGCRSRSIFLKIIQDESCMMVVMRFIKYLQKEQQGDRVYREFLGLTCVSDLCMGGLGRGQQRVPEMYQQWRLRSGSVDILVPISAG